MRAADAAAFAQKPAQGVDFHDGVDAGVVGDEPFDGRFDRGAAAFLDFEGDAVAGFGTEDFRELCGNEEAAGGKRERVSLLVEDAIERRV